LLVIFFDAMDFIYQNICRTSGSQYDIHNGRPIYVPVRMKLDTRIALICLALKPKNGLIFLHPRLGAPRLFIFENSSSEALKI